MNLNIIESKDYNNSYLSLNNSLISLDLKNEEIKGNNTTISLNNTKIIKSLNMEIFVDFKKIDFTKLTVLDFQLTFYKNLGYSESKTIYDYSEFSGDTGCFFNTITITTKNILSLTNKNFILCEYDISLNFIAELTVTTNLEKNEKSQIFEKIETATTFFQNSKTIDFQLISKLETKNKLKIIQEENNIIKYSITSKDRVSFEKKYLLSTNKKDLKEIYNKIFSSLNQVYYNDQKNYIKENKDISYFYSLNIK